MVAKVVNKKSSVFGTFDIQTMFSKHFPVFVLLYFVFLSLFKPQRKLPFAAIPPNFEPKTHFCQTPSMSDKLYRSLEMLF